MDAARLLQGPARRPHGSLSESVGRGAGVGGLERQAPLRASWDGPTGCAGAEKVGSGLGRQGQYGGPYSQQVFGVPGGGAAQMYPSPEVTHTHVEAAHWSGYGPTVHPQHGTAYGQPHPAHEIFGSCSVPGSGGTHPAYSAPNRPSAGPPRPPAFASQPSSIYPSAPASAPRTYTPYSFSTSGADGLSEYNPDCFGTCQIATKGAAAARRAVPPSFADARTGAGAYATPSPDGDSPVYEAAQQVVGVAKVGSGMFRDERYWEAGVGSGRVGRDGSGGGGAERWEEREAKRRRA